MQLSRGEVQTRVEEGASDSVTIYSVARGRVSVENGCAVFSIGEGGVWSARSEDYCIISNDGPDGAELHVTRSC